ncbi:MAG: tyrosine-type recombinase/integrase [Meiothermus sp.]|nr:tyrosine-type recombinase/integrase [Meiothermus sp.]
MPNKKGTRKAHGEAHIRRRADGTYEAQVALGYQNGKRVRKSIYGKTEAEIVKKKNQLLAEYGLGIALQPDKMTVAQLLDEWLEHKKLSTKITTQTWYERAVRLHIKPELGSVLVQKLETRHIDALYRKLTKKGLSSASVKQVHAAIFNALKQARRWKIVIANVAEDVTLPKGETFEPTIWSLDESRRFLEAAQGDRFYALYILALLGGFRRGELFALRWNCIALEQHPVHGAYVSVTVMKNRTVAGNTVVEHDPKTHRSKRPVILPSEVWTILQAHKGAMEAERVKLVKAGYTPNDEGYVFLSTYHTPIHPTNFYQREFKPLLSSVKVPFIRFHDLRHVNITLDMVSSGDLKTASQRAGHSNIGITANVYQHPDVQLHLGATSKLARMLLPTGSVNDQGHTA